ncbi:UV DNA damage repair endonuclease UvsE [Bacillus kexueae]|uniref:UV DNA damage repair endonuclease UvsE n=1 Tax=Aeribacillus kexueae TaxID=2078952 RepID=UPI001FAF08EE|nr:UV DNA damage repair endonuclease UvsE [Bacillus kexueae]
MYVRLGYVAMSVHLHHCSPSQTMTFRQFTKIKDREAAIRKLERIARSNIENCLRILKHNRAHDIQFFRLSSRLIPLANHEALADWDYLSPLEQPLKEIRKFLSEHPMRIDFHPDHFVVLNTKDVSTLKTSIQALHLHEQLLKRMGIPLKHRCVIHVGGGYEDQEKALEQFIHNWAYVPERIQNLIMLENDDTTFTMSQTLYLCEKLGIPFVFDFHHHEANNGGEIWEEHWERAIQTWNCSPLPMKMHISSPRDEVAFRAHHDYINAEQFYQFLCNVKGSIDQLDCMIEAKQKDEALFRLMHELSSYPNIEVIDQASFHLK